MPEYEIEELPDNRDSDDSASSLYSEFGVPIMWTPGVKKALTPTNKKLRRSSQAKTQVTQYAYNDYMAHHYAFAMKVAAKLQPEKTSLCHRLEGENRSNYTNPKPRNKATKRRTTKPRRAAEQSREEPIYRAKPRRKTQAEARTLQLCTTQAEARIRVDASRRGFQNASRSGLWISSETDLT